MMAAGEWYVILSGAHEGRWHMAGWQASAHLGVSSGPRDDGWLTYGTCPRCSAVVEGNAAGPVGPNIWAHEQWHARTDHPIPTAEGSPS